MNKITNTYAALTLFLVGLVVYFQVFLNGFVGDDMSQIYNRALVNNFFDLPKVFFYHHVVLGSEHSLLSGYYKPLMLFYFYTIRLVFGLNPFFYHAPQIVFLVVNSFLVFLLFSKFFKRHLALIFAALFLIHPINQETAAYVSSIQEVLFFFFGMIALLRSFKNNNQRKNLIWIGIFLLLSLLSKETGILFLSVFLLYEFLFHKKLFKKSLIVAGGVLAIYAVFRLFSQVTAAFWIEPPPMAYVSTMGRVMHAPYLFFYYIKTFFYPGVLSFNQQWIITKFNFSNLFLPIILDIIFVCLLFGISLFLFRKKSKQKTVFLFFTIWFFAGVVPHLQILPLDATVATRWFYFSSVGLIGILTVGYEYLEDKFRDYSKLFYLLLIFLCLALGIRTMVRNNQWRNAFILYSTDFGISQSPLLENNLGDEYFKQGNLKQAQVHFEKALTMNPNLWIAINNLGILSEKEKNLQSALFYYRRAFQNGKRLPVAENIARILVFQKKYREAKKFTKTELILYPLSAKLWLTLAFAEYNLHEYNAALSAAQKSYQLVPDMSTLQVIQALQAKMVVN